MNQGRERAFGSLQFLKKVKNSIDRFRGWRSRWIVFCGGKFHSGRFRPARSTTEFCRMQVIFMTTFKNLTTSYIRTSTGLVSKKSTEMDSFLLLKSEYCPTLIAGQKIMNEISKPSNQEGTLERRVKSVNFMDQQLCDYACMRAAALYGGNFSGYINDLVERDRATVESRRAAPDFESKILEIIGRHGGVLSRQNDPFGFEISTLQVAIKAVSRFPRERPLEYQLLSDLHRCTTYPQYLQIILTYPSGAPAADKDRFRQIKSAGIDRLRVYDLIEMEQALDQLAAEQQVRAFA